MEEARPAYVAVALRDIMVIRVRFLRAERRHSVVGCAMCRSRLGVGSRSEMVVRAAIRERPSHSWRSTVRAVSADR
jgi:hypothetical protein